jgi:hypothetical protein
MLNIHAQAICGSKTAGQSWDYIRCHSTSFIWSDDENPVSTWNRLIGTDLQGLAEAQTSEGGTVQYSYAGNTMHVPLRFNRDDGLLAIHTLGQLVRQHSEFRLCLDSTHSSDVAFLALPPTDWIGLESNVKGTMVARHFLSLNPDFDVFLVNAYPTPSVPFGTLASSETDWEGGATYKPAELDYLNVSDGPGRPRVASLAQIIGRYLEPGLVTVGFRGTAKKDLVDRRDLMAAIAPHLGVSQVRLANAARTGFVVVESNGVAAGWRTDGRTTIDEAPRPWWKLWK